MRFTLQNKKIFVAEFFGLFVGEIEILFVMREEQIFVNNIRKKNF